MGVEIYIYLHKISDIAIDKGCPVAGRLFVKLSVMFKLNPNTKWNDVKANKHDLG